MIDNKLPPPEPEEQPDELTAPVSIPPHDREAEEATLGSVLIDPDCYPDLVSILDPADFYIRRHGWIWQAFGNLVRRGDPLDFLTIPEELFRMGQLEEIGGPAYLTGLLNQVPSSLHAATYARKVKDVAIKRRLLDIANEIALLAYNPRISAAEASRRAQEAIKENTGGQEKRVTIHDAVYALAPRPPIRWIVEGLIYEKSITVIYGDGGTKKTWASMYLAACVASGAYWGDYKTNKTRVLFIDEENGDDEIAARAAFCIRGALADKNIDLHYISLAAFQLNDPQDELLLTTIIQAQGAGLVILDALADLMSGDENSKQDTQPVFNALRRIAEKTGAAIVVIHHANKNGGHRGSSVIKDAPDILLQVTSDPDSNFVNFKTEKNRKGKGLQWSMFATWTEDRFYLSPVEGQEKGNTQTRSHEYVLRFLADNGASELPVIESSADTCSFNAARQAVYALAAKGKIRRTNPGGKPAIYELTKQSI
jgi:hypothetical protein